MKKNIDSLFDEMNALNHNGIQAKNKVLQHAQEQENEQKIKDTFAKDIQVLAVETLHVDDDYKNYIRPQSEDEAKQFKESVAREGVRDALIIYYQEGKPTIVDGHHRYFAAKEFGIAELACKTLAFENKDEACLWMLQNQLGRRNLKDAERIHIALEITSFLEKKGKENRQLGLRQGTEIPVFANWQKREESINRTKKAAELAGVSERNVSRYKKVKDSGDQSLIESTLSGETSIHKAYETVKNPSKKAPQKAPSKTKDDKVLEAFVKIEAYKNNELSEQEMLAYLEQIIK